MTKNTNNTSNAVLTEKEIFDQIVLLQKQLSSDIFSSLHRLGEALGNARGEDEGSSLSDDQVANICAVFSQREETLHEMLTLYQDMYNDLKKKNEN